MSSMSMSKTTPGEITMAGKSTVGIMNGFQQEKEEYRWKIRNWTSVVRCNATIESQKFVMKVGRSSSIRSEWEVGLQLDPDDPIYWMFYWKLIKAPEPRNELHSTLNVTVITNNKSDQVNSKVILRSRKLNLNDKGTMGGLFRFRMQADYSREGYLDVEGAMNFLVTLTVMLPSKLVSNAQQNFAKIFVTKTVSNFAAELIDSSPADLNIVSSDAQEHPAHKIILKAQCPVFASMFRSQFSEATTGVVNVQDISGKTMGILLHLFYTGELLPSWSDEDTIVEFTYAAGKYQMTEVLQMLDTVLGETDGNETSGFDVELLNVANKLSLKNAEKRLMKRVKKLVDKMDNAADLFALFTNITAEESYPGN